MKLPKLKNMEYYVDVNSRKFKITAENVSYLIWDSSKFIQGTIRLEQVIGKKQVPVWKGTIKNPFKFEKEERDKTKTLSYISGEVNHHYIDPIKFTAKNFDEFYNRIKFVSTKYDESYPSKENAKLFFGKLFEHYKNISDKFLN